MFSRAVMFIERRLGLLVFSAAGLLFGWSLPGIFLGAVLGFFLDSITREMVSLRAAEAFLFRGGGAALDDQERKELALGYLFFRILQAGGIPSEMFREKQEILYPAELLNTGGKSRLTLDRARRIAGETRDVREVRETREIRQTDRRLILSLNFCLTPGEKERFFRVAAGSVPWGGDETPAPELMDYFVLISAAWGLPEEAFPDIFSPAVRGGDPWLLLGLTPGAPEGEIRKTYRLLAAQFHPDTMAELSAEQKTQAGEAFARISRAYAAVLEKPRES